MTRLNAARLPTFVHWTVANAASLGVLFGVVATPSELLQQYEASDEFRIWLFLLQTASAVILPAICFYSQRLVLHAAGLPAPNWIVTSYVAVVAACCATFCMTLLMVGIVGLWFAGHWLANIAPLSVFLTLAVYLAAFKPPAISGLAAIT